MASLFDKVRYREYLLGAWTKVRLAGSQSRSRATRAAVNEFQERAARNLERIQEELRSGRYRFRAGHGVPIPRDGKSPRPIVVQDVRDRVVQRSLLDVLWEVPKVVEEVDHGLSVGGVPNRGIRDALRPVLQRIREQPGGYYIRSDIRDFFGQMPRMTALSILKGILPDRSIDTFLELATETELANRQELGHLIDFFPDPVTGVPQGHALSALLGNLLLRDLDRELNRDDTLGVRYLDDFLIVGSNKSAAWAAFRRARNQLSRLGLQCYSPDESRKAKEGPTRRMFEFLGCELSPSFVRPSRANRTRMLAEVRDRLRRSNAAMKGGQFTNDTAYGQSVASTLMKVSRFLRGWSEQYAFGNYDPLQCELDEEIDREIGRFLATYVQRRECADGPHRRRMIGVWLLSDAARNPLIHEVLLTHDERDQAVP